MYFPLYDLLIKKVSNKKITKNDKKLLVERINSFEEEELTIVYGLIRKHANLNGDSSKLPFNGKLEEKDVVFKIDDFPEELCKILMQFVVLNKEKVKQDQTIKKKVENILGTDSSSEDDESESDDSD